MIKHHRSIFRKYALQAALLLAFLLSAHGLQAQLNPADNNPMPKHIAVDIADLLVLEDPAVATTDETHFAVKAHLYNSLLNLLATSKATCKILYTDKIAPYISYSRDEVGVYHYEVIPGQEDALLGYSSCLNTTKFSDVLCKDQKENFTIDANVDFNSDTYLWVYLNATYSSLAADLTAAGYQHYQWVAATGEGDYYDLYVTQYDNGSGGFDNSLSGGIWVGIKCDEPATHDWTVTGNKQDGLTAFSNGEHTMKSQSNATNEKVMMRSTSSTSAGSLIKTAMKFYVVMVVFGVTTVAVSVVGGVAVAAGAALIGASPPVVLTAGAVAGIIAGVEFIKWTYHLVSSVLEIL